MHKLMFHKDLALACRLATTAAHKASLFTVFGTEVSEEEEAAGRRRRSGGRGVGSACTVGWREEKRKKK